MRHFQAQNIMVIDMKGKILSIIATCDDERMAKRLQKRVAHRYCATHGVSNKFDEETGRVIRPTLPSIPAMLDSMADRDFEVILKSRPFRKIMEESRMKESLENEIPMEKGEGILTFLADEFESFEAKSDAWSLANSKNMFTRRIKVLLKRNPVDRFSILNGRAGRFVWIKYRDEDDTLGDGGVASGNIEDNPIHYDGMVFDDINYSKIAFSFIPVDDF